MDIEQRIARIDNTLNDVKFELYPEVILDNEFDILVGGLIQELRGLQQDYIDAYL
jgi:hypothetical protein